MADAVATLSTTLQGQVSGAGATIPTIAALSALVLSSAQALVQTRLAQRVGLLNAVLTPANLPGNTRVVDIAGRGTRCLRREALLLLLLRRMSRWRRCGRMNRRCWRR
jgi:hypothetical protein